MAASHGNGKILGVALAVTLGLVWWAGQVEDEDEIIPAVRPGKAVSRVVTRPSDRTSLPSDPLPAALGMPWERLLSRTAKSRQPEVDLFKAHAWFEPSPKRMEALPPPKPAAPPVPFGYVGKLEDGPNGTMLMLVAGNTLHTVAIGDVMDGQWRLDAETADSLRLTYLPLGLSHTIPKSSRAGSGQVNHPSNTPNQGTES